jgi:hypothetical protein
MVLLISSPPKYSVKILNLREIILFNILSQLVAHAKPVVFNCVTPKTLSYKIVSPSYKIANVSCEVDGFS